MNAYKTSPCGEFATVSTTAGEFVVDTADLPRVLLQHWYLSSKGYVRTTTGRRRAAKPLELQRFLLPDAQYVDHRDGNPLNNRRENLRPCSNAENTRNSKKRSTPTSSRFKGVSLHKASGRWQANIRVDGKNRYLGYYQEEADAAQAYNFAAAKYFGEFARFNEAEQTCPLLAGA